MRAVVRAAAYLIGDSFFFGELLFKSSLRLNDNVIYFSWSNGQNFLTQRS